MLPRELLKRIRKIEIVTERLVRERMAGQYHSVFKGRGIAFSEVRHYIPGDDIRLIDWNVTARMNDVFVKLFSEERFGGQDMVVHELLQPRQQVLRPRAEVEIHLSPDT